MNILGFSGSLRKASIHTSLLRAADELAPEGVSIKLFDIADIPLYDDDDATSKRVAGFVAAFVDFAKR